jgi:hypothetical protein
MRRGHLQDRRMTERTGGELVLRVYFCKLLQIIEVVKTNSLGVTLHDIIISHCVMGTHQKASKFSCLRLSIFMAHSLKAYINSNSRE